MNRPAYKEWAPAPVLARHLDCLWVAHAADDGAAHTERVLPDGCVDVIWDGASVFVAGPDTGPVPFRPAPGAVFVGARFRPGLAPTLLGLPSDALRDHRVPLEDMWDPAAVARLADELHDAIGRPSTAAQVLEACLTARLPGATPPDALVEAAVNRLACDRGPGTVSRLAAGLGVSERSLHRRTIAAVGYGPKTLERVLRFRRFLWLAGAGPVGGLAGLGVEAGYADQAHLTRDCVELSGLTPKALLAGRDVRSVQDGGPGPDAGWPV
jgi:AraC-like DNA-binding protein